MRYWKWMEYEPGDAETGITGDQFFMLDAVAAEDEAEAYRILEERWPRQYFEGNELIEIKKNEYDAIVAQLEEDAEFDPPDGPWNDSEMDMWELIATKRVKDSDGFLTDYTMYYNPVPDLYVMVFGDNELYQPEDGDWDFETESKQEAFEWFRNYNGFEDEDVEAATDVSRPDPEGDNLYGGQVNQEKYDLYKLRDKLAELRDRTTGLRDKYWESDSMSMLSTVYENISEIINVMDNYLQPTWD